MKQIPAVFCILTAFPAFFLGTYLDTSNWNPLEPNEVAECVDDDMQESLENVGWGMQQDREAEALHTGFIEGISADSEEQYFKFLDKDNLVEPDWQRKEHHYKAAGFAVGNFMYHMNSVQWYIDGKSSLSGFLDSEEKS